MRVFVPGGKQMVRSMTGFGRSEYSDEKRNVTAEIKSVNHRYNDINVRMPRRYSFAEETIKSAVKTFARRGKIEVSVMVENIGDEEVNIRLNPAVAEAVSGKYPGTERNSRNRRRCDTGIYRVFCRML